MIHLPDDLVLKLLGLAPLPQARQAEAVVAGGHDSKPVTGVINLFGGVISTSGANVIKRFTVVSYEFS